MKQVRTKTGEATTFLAKVYSKHEYAACWVEDRHGRDRSFFVLSRHDVTVLREWLEEVDALLATEIERTCEAKATAPVAGGE